MSLVRLRSNKITEANFDLAGRRIYATMLDATVTAPPNSRFVTYDESDRWYLDYARLWRHRLLEVGDEVTIRVDTPFSRDTFDCRMVVEVALVNFSVGSLVRYEVVGRILHIERNSLGLLHAEQGV